MYYTVTSIQSIDRFLFCSIESPIFAFFHEKIKLFGTHHSNTNLTTKCSDSLLAASSLGQIDSPLMPFSSTVNY